MRYRPLGTDPDDPRLGRLIPDDWEHVDRYPLSAVPTGALPVKTPVVIGVNWYREFDNPVRNLSGEYWIARGGPRSLTRIRGGHCVCLEPGGGRDLASWHSFYDQGTEGACVGFGWSRAMSILNRQRYAARWLWDRAKQVDQWPDTNPGDNNGTSVRAAADTLAKQGHVTWSVNYTTHNATQRATYRPTFAAGITHYRWATTVDEVHAVLGFPLADRLEAVPVLNSWGTSWPRRVWLPDEVLARLITEDGEIAIPTDR